MKTRSANAAKASFDDIYVQPTPHDYCSHLARLDYSICDETRRFVAIAADLLRRSGSRVRMLDIGCSYGINAAAVKHGVLFAELARFFEANVERDRDVAIGQVRSALADAGVEVEMECGGLDVSGPAVNFAVASGLLDHGIVADLEQDAGGGALSEADLEWVRQCNLILATGAIGYVTERTLDVLLSTMAERAPEAVVLLTVLRVFDTAPIEACLQRHGLTAAACGDVLLPQRRFHGAGEQRDIVAVLEEQGLDPTPERAGRHYARLLVAARSDRLPGLLSELGQVASSSLTLQAEPGRKRALSRAIGGPSLSG